MHCTAAAAAAAAAATTTTTTTKKKKKKKNYLLLILSKQNSPKLYEKPFQYSTELHTNTTIKQWETKSEKNRNSEDHSQHKHT